MSQLRRDAWTALAQFAGFAACIGAIYLIFRFAIDIPPALALVINVVVVLAALWMARWMHAKWRAQQASGVAAAPVSVWQIVMAVFVVLGMLTPIWVVLYFVWLGGQLWR